METLRAEKDSSGNIITYEYNDTRNDFTKVQPTQSITKDSNNNIISNRKYEYDEKGNILKETDFVERKSQGMSTVKTEVVWLKRSRKLW